MSFIRILYLTILLILRWGAYVQGVTFRVFNVMKYGAISDGKTETSKAFMEAWKAACKWHGYVMVLVPPGEYVLDSTLFQGECNGYMVFQLKGILKPAGKLKSIEQWITFRYLNGFTLSGGGTFDGQGYKVWPCKKSFKCNTLPVSLRLEFVKNGTVNNIRSVNSQNAHMSLFGCTNLYMTHLVLSAPFDSPNTDGIKIGASNQIRIAHASIGTGDDCIAILNGSKNLNISQVFCGPGHGISVGSMGGFDDIDKAETVLGVTVTNCTFKGTTHGLRIKTWSSPHSGLASHFMYEKIKMINVGNPIIIDQKYCPYPPCDTKTPSHIQIKDLRFNNVWGTSKSKVAVTLNCSSAFPCRDVVMKDIKLYYKGDRGVSSTSSSCSNVMGNSYGYQKPPSCFH